MIANIITTILLAIGVATGNVSSNVYKGGNVFNNDNKIEEKQITNKKGYETFTHTYTKVAEYTATDQATSGNTYNYRNKKYYQNNKLNDTTDFGNIYNSTYVTEYYETGNNNPSPYNATAQLIGIYEITPYLTSQNTSVDYEVRYSITRTDQNTAHMRVQYWSYIAIDVEYYRNFIDLTTYQLMRMKTPATQNLLNIDFSNTKANLYDEYETTEYVAPNSTHDLTRTITIGNLTSVTTIITRVYITYYEGTRPIGSETYLQPLEWTMEGWLIDVNYEVIDLPSLMFNILTMPFSFISQAFNLTVFPGTPYAFNFGNVFLTIIAAFILMWLIKKVF